jgi:methionyl-tRNA formyltransferase
MKIALIGGVTSTLVTLEKLIEHGLRPARVYGYEPADADLVSGYAWLKPACDAAQVDYAPFRLINDHSSAIAAEQYDIAFIVGLSQLVSDDIIQHVRLGCVGFHPTLLPRGRGRAPIAWLVLEETMGAANLFLIDRNADAGPVFEQVPFCVTPEDDAASVEEKALAALGEALDRWLPRLKRDEWNPVAQDEMHATEYGRRLPEDGWIDWHQDAESIHKLVKASTHPHPGAYTFAGEKKMTVWASRVEDNMRIRGVTGRVLKRAPDGALLMQTGHGLLWLTNHAVEGGSPVRVGMRLGFYAEQEIYLLKRDIRMIKERLGL